MVFYEMIVVFLYFFIFLLNALQRTGFICIITISFVIMPCKKMSRLPVFVVVAF